MSELRERIEGEFLDLLEKIYPGAVPDDKWRNDIAKKRTRNVLIAVAKVVKGTSPSGNVYTEYGKNQYWKYHDFRDGQIAERASIAEQLLE